MSEPIPESIPTSADPRSKRPLKKRALSPTSKQSANIEALFAHPEREIKIPTGPVKKSLPPPPEIVTNVQGSSAGAGSGEFHVYKMSRRREYERVRMMEDEVEKEEKDQEWADTKRAAEQEIEKKRSKNAKRRQRKKAHKDGVKKSDGTDFDKPESNSMVQSDVRAIRNGRCAEDITNGNVNTLEEVDEKEDDGIKIVDDD